MYTYIVSLQSSDNWKQEVVAVPATKGCRASFDAMKIAEDRNKGYRVSTVTLVDDAE